MSATGAASPGDVGTEPRASTRPSPFDLSRLSRQEALAVVVIGVFLLVSEGINLGYRPYSPVVLVAAIGTGVGALLLVLVQRAVPLVGAVLMALLLVLFVDIYFLKPWYLVAVVAVAAIALLVSRARRPFLTFFAVFAVIFSVLVFINRDTSLLSPDQPEWDDDLRGKTADQPAIVHLVLDEFMGTRGLREVTGMSEAEVAAIESGLVGQGFRVYRNARSVSLLTKFSISNFLTGRNEAGNITSKPPAPNLSGYRHYLKENRYFDALLAAGYSLHALYNTFLRLCPNQPMETVACRSFGLDKQGALADRRSMSFRQSLNAYLLALGESLMDPRSVEGVSALTMTFGRNERIQAPETGHVLSSLELLGRLTAEIANAKRGQAYFAHLLVPHRPWILGPDCMIADAAARSEHEQYRDQLLCIMAGLDGFLEAIEANPELRDAVVLVQGDHGARMDKTEPDPNLDHDAPHMLDVYNAFVAIRAPGFAPGVDDREVPLASVVGWVPQAVGAGPPW